MNSDNIDRLDWEVLNALADDYESMEQIQHLIMPAELSPDEIIDRLHKLHKNNYIYLTLNMQFDRNSLLKEIKETKQRKYWFGRTEKGYLAWQKHAPEYFKKNNE